MELLRYWPSFCSPLDTSIICHEKSWSRTIHNVDLEAQVDEEDEDGMDEVEDEMSMIEPYFTHCSRRFSRYAAMETCLFPSTLLGRPQRYDSCSMCRHSYMINVGVIPPQMESASDFQTFAPKLYTMPVPINDKRQEWLRKHAPRPESIKAVDTSKLRVVMATENEHFGQFYKIHAMTTLLGTRHWYHYYGEPLGHIEKAQLAKGFNMFLRTLPRLEEQRKSDSTTEVSDINREPATAPNKTADHVDVPVVLYSKENQPPSQFMAQASLAKDGILFDWREELSSRLSKGQSGMFERWMGDGTFASPRERLEWVPRGQALVYKVAGVIHCPDIVQFASGRSCSPSTKFLPSPSRSSPVQNSHTANSKASPLVRFDSRKRYLVSPERQSRKRARNSSPIEDVVEKIIDLVSDDEVLQVADAYKSKGKARAPDLGDIVELSD